MCSSGFTSFGCSSQDKASVHSATAPPSLVSQPSHSHPWVSYTSGSSSATSPTPEGAAGVLGQTGPPLPHGNAPESSHYKLPSGSTVLTHHEEDSAAEASSGLRGPSPRLTASTGTPSCGNGRMHSTQLCQANQNPAPKSPSGDNAKGSKRPLLRRERISSTLARYLSQRRSWEQKVHIFRVTRKDQSADFPWHCNTQTLRSRAQC